MNEELKQDTSQKAPERTLLIAQLLFREKPAEVSVEELKKAVEEIIGETELVYDSPNAPFFAMKDYRAAFQKEEGREYNSDVDNGDGTVSVPILANFILCEEFKPIDDPMITSQFWDYTGDINEFKYHTSVFGMLSGTMGYKKEAELFLKEIEVAVKCFPTAECIYIPHSGKLTSIEHFKAGIGESLAVRFIRTAVNARFFRAEDTDDFVVDTLGFFAFGAPEVQMHFHGLEPDSVVSYVYSIASYQFDGEFPVKPYDTVDGLDENGDICQAIQWSARYEDALIQPIRTVLDINCGEYASGNRE